MHNGVTRGAMDATGVSWKPVWAFLEDDFDGLLGQRAAREERASGPGLGLGRALGGDYFRTRDPERQTRRLISQLENLGHKVTLEGLPQAV